MTLSTPNTHDTQGEVSIERLEEILAGLEGVTPGPWTYGAQYLCRKAGPSEQYERLASCLPGQFDGIAWNVNAAHIARLDPATVRSIVSELIALRTAKPADGWVLVPKEDLEGMASDGHAWAQAMLDDRCFICDLPFRQGEMVLGDATEGLGHRSCFGEDREGYVGENGGPLEDGEPIPAGWPFEPSAPKDNSHE